MTERGPARWRQGVARWWALWLGASLLVGCATPTLEQQPSADRLSGRLAVRVDGDAARSFSAAFELDGTAERGRLSLTTPLGAQLAQADWSREHVRLRADGRDREYADLDSLAADALGEHLPLAALFDWLRGRTWPQAPSVSTASGFAQLGWDVDVSRRAEGWVVMRRSAEPPVTVRAKLDAP